MPARPRGAHNEPRRDVAVLLRAVAAAVTSTTAALTDARRPPSDTAAVHHALLLAESSFAQDRSEPQRPGAPQPDWRAALIAGRRAERGGRRLPEHHDPNRRDRPGEDRPGPAARARLTGRADDVAGAYRGLTDRLDEGPDRTVTDRRPTTGPGPPSAATGRADTPVTAPPPLYGTDTWLRGLAADLVRVTAPTG